MTKRAMLLVLCALVLLLCALSTRGAIFWLLFWVLGIMMLLSLTAAIWARSTLTLTCAFDQPQITRGSRVNLTIDILCRCPLPISALQLEVCPLDSGEPLSLHANIRPYVINRMVYALYCPHVGTYHTGIESARVQDVFGLFLLRRKLPAAQNALTVVPKVQAARSLVFSPGESDNDSTLARAFEDATMPSDLRAFQQGDELKKVHWKLSMRRKELIVRVYEQPLRPDALLLVDCAPPDAPPERQADVRDALCDAAASVASVALQDGAPVRLPLLGDTPMDVNASKPEDIAVICSALGHCAFDGTQQFERVLLLETRRMRRTGSTAIFTSRMNPTIADMILRMRRMGPKIRVMLAADAQDETVALLTTRLMRNDVEVETIQIKANAAQ